MSDLLTSSSFLLTDQSIKNLGRSHALYDAEWLDHMPQRRYGTAQQVFAPEVLE
ncbi:MAG: hypothetical protein QM744_08145 [Mesorhizobium sp.]